MLTPRDFAFVFNEPKWAVKKQIAVIGRMNTLVHPRVGLAVAKKNVKRSNERNRIKRLIRESFRLYQHALPRMDFVVMAKKGVVEMDKPTLTEALLKLWHSHCKPYKAY